MKEQEASLMQYMQQPVEPAPMSDYEKYMQSRQEQPPSQMAPTMQQQPTPE